MKTEDVMVDLETLGTGARAAVVAIGAVRFDDRCVYAKSAFYARVDLGSCLKAGLEIDPETVVWWLSRDGAAAHELWAKPRLPLADALARFTAWLGEDARNVKLWGNGAAFDNAILSEAYRAVGQRQPWHFANDRCYRTEKASCGAVLVRQGTYHHAKDDAITQARHLVKIWSR